MTPAFPSTFGQRRTVAISDLDAPSLAAELRLRGVRADATEDAEELEDRLQAELGGASDVRLLSAELGLLVDNRRGGLFPGQIFASDGEGVEEAAFARLVGGSGGRRAAAEGEGEPEPVLIAASAASTRFWPTFSAAGTAPEGHDFERRDDDDAWSLVGFEGEARARLGAAIARRRQLRRRGLRQLRQRQRRGGGSGRFFALFGRTKVTVRDARVVASAGAMMPVSPQFGRRGSGSGGGGGGGVLRWRRLDELPVIMGAAVGGGRGLRARDDGLRYSKQDVAAEDAVAFCTGRGPFYRTLRRAGELPLDIDGDAGDYDDAAPDDAAPAASDDEDAEARRRGAAALRSLSMHGVTSVGAPFGGLAFHRHDAAWLALLSGRKLWCFCSPSTPPASAHRRQNVGLTVLEPHVKVAVQRPGEIMVVPRGWWHATYNLGPEGGLEEEEEEEDDDDDCSDDDYGGRDDGEVWGQQESNGGRRVNEHVDTMLDQLMDEFGGGGGGDDDGDDDASSGRSSSPLEDGFAIGVGGLGASPGLHWYAAEGDVEALAKAAGAVRLRTSSPDDSDDSEDSCYNDEDSDEDGAFVSGGRAGDELTEEGEEVVVGRSFDVGDGRRVVYDLCGVDLEALRERTGSGKTLMHTACYHGHVRVAKWLAAVDPPPPPPPPSLFEPRSDAAAATAAASSSAFAVAGFSGAAGDACARDALGMQPLHWAAANSHVKTVAFLLENGAHPRAPSTLGETPTDIAKKRRGPNSKRTLSLLVRNNLL